MVRPNVTPQLLSDAPALGWSWEVLPPSDVAVTGITHDSREVHPGDIYAALPGARVHGARFAAQAVASGARAILTDPIGREEAAATGVPVAVHTDPREVTGELAAWVYGYPAREVLLLGLTGTNGKTTTSYLVEGGLSAAGHRTGVIGTTGIWIDDERIPSARTTPEATDVHALLAAMVEKGVTAVVMEVSSHALAYGRVDGLQFDVVLFTNLSQDHLDFHADMEDYFLTKAGLFSSRRARAAVVCVDDEWGVRLASHTPLPVTTYGLGDRSGGRLVALGDVTRDWTAYRIEPTSQGHLAVSVAGPDGATQRLESPLPGRFNAANALGAFVVLLTAGIGADHARQGLLLARSVPGRMERVGSASASFPVFVDYAHTPDAVERVLRAGRQLATGDLVVVLGCGGDRDRGKRPLMGETAARLADKVAVTDDNPRSEDPAEIRSEIAAGIPMPLRGRAVEIADRREAIRWALGVAQPGDAVMVLGKGHEQGQEVAGVVHPFDDRQEVLAALGSSGGGMP